MFYFARREVANFLMANARYWIEEFHIDGRGTGIEAEYELVGAAQEVDRLEIFTSAKFIGDPLAVGATVIEVEHRRHGIDAQPIDVEFLDPVTCVRHQEIGHLAPAEIENISVPIRLKPLAPIGVLIDRGAIEAREAMVIRGKLAWHPVEQKTDAGRVAGIDEEAEIVGCTEPAGRCEHTNGLIAPRTVERKLGHRQSLPDG